MSGIYSGIQQRISSNVSNAPFIHCCAHNLNLVICDAAASTEIANNFFLIVQSIYNFFSTSAPRWANLALNSAKKIRQKVLKKVCPTRWEARYESVSALKERYIDVLKSLTGIILTSDKLGERNMANSLKKKIEHFQFVLMLCLWERVLRPFHGVSKLLQQRNMDLHNARDRLAESFSSIQNLRNDYINIVKYAKDLCIKWDIPLNSSQKTTTCEKIF
ncbi:uncharacterized protein LOC126553383 [Aphis gossypii]|uniref:uncharacterized protein LOC126553383 n=1 Tax=Aphis gossypii TaxID=80765 RepID=UPI0021595659|nr:uncharacterized protein LOC126553383 [Aphis gossypii]